MKLELDENLPHDLATAVRGDGQDVHTVIDEQFAGDGVLVLRPAAQDPDSILALNQRLVRTHPVDELRGCPVVVEPRKVRIRRPDQDDLS